MTEKGKARNKGKIRKIIILKCDSCGKENRIREKNLYQKELDATNSNNGCYCSKCRLRDRKDFSYNFCRRVFYCLSENYSAERISRASRRRRKSQRNKNELCSLWARFRADKKVR